MKMEIAKYVLSEILFNLEKVINNIKQDGFENEQFYLDFLDKLNELSIEWKIL